MYRPEKVSSGEPASESEEGGSSSSEDSGLSDSAEDEGIFTKQLRGTSKIMDLANVRANQYHHQSPSGDGLPGSEESSAT